MFIKIYINAASVTHTFKHTQSLDNEDSIDKAACLVILFWNEWNCCVTVTKNVTAAVPFIKQSNKNKYYPYKLEINISSFFIHKINTVYHPC